MMHKDKEFTINSLSATACGAETSSETQEKLKYEKPVLSIVKFTFENDITWGSFESDQQGDNGDNEVAPGQGWWNS